MKRRTWTTVVWALGVFLMLTTRSWSAAPGHPVVGTRFTITAGTFRENLGSRRAALEAAVAQRMAQLCAEELSYVEWQALTNEPAADDPLWVLRGSMVAGSSSTFIPAVSVQFERVGPEPSARPLIVESLYRANDLEQPTQDSSRLREDLLEMVRVVFSNTENLRKLQTQFLVKIPVARALEPNPNLERVVLPARWGDLLPGDGSQLRATYSIRRPDGTTLDVRMDLSPSVAVSDKIACAVTLFDHPPLPRQTAWHISMPDSVRSAIPESIKVFMSQYVKDYSYSPTTMEGLVTQPFEGSGAGGGR
jgi:hypothetical protein